VQWSSPSALVARAGAGLVPLSYAQERLWFLDQLGVGTPKHPCGARLEGCADVGALERTFAEVVRRHESLRTQV